MTKCKTRYPNYAPELVSPVNSLTPVLQGLNTQSYTGRSTATKLKG